MDSHVAGAIPHDCLEVHSRWVYFSVFWWGVDVPSTHPGMVIGGRYRVVREIGSGGMGAIHEVLHLELDRTFAMKTIHAGYQADPQALARFRREARIIGRLRHHHVANVVDWQEMDNGSPCIIMELLRGQTLADRIKSEGPLPWDFLARISDQVLSALVAAHRCGIVHRDLKPENIFIASDDAEDEQAKLLDFGVAKLRVSDTALTGDERLLGTPSYMSPEQANGEAKSVGSEADVWAMGAVLFEMATARKAFPAETALGVLYRICHGAPEFVTTYRHDAPHGFVALLERTLSRDIGVRLCGAQELRTQLREALETGERRVWGPKSNLPRASAWKTKRVVGLGAAVVVLGGFAIAANLGGVLHRQPSIQPRDGPSHSVVDREAPSSRSGVPSGPTQTALKEPSAAPTDLPLNSEDRRSSDGPKDTLTKARTAPGAAAKKRLARGRSSPDAAKNPNEMGRGGDPLERMR